ncbi:MAG: YncE family protein [Proteobacteria bacterium]|nr:YncE family protein [Pseudomonadota bacterium]
MKQIHIAAVLAVAALASPAAAFDGWHQVGATEIESKGSAWDYVAFEATRNRLFIGHRKEGLQIFDLATRKLVGVLDGTPAASSNGATLMPEFDLGISNNENGTITPFKLSTLAASPAIKLGEEIDTSHYDPVSKRLLVNMGSGADGTELIALDVPSLNVAGMIKVKTKKPEHADADGKGNLFMAARDTNQVLRIDMRTLKVTGEWATPGCDQTNGLAMDGANNRVYVGCRGSDKAKPMFAVLDGESGRTIYTSEIGGGNDGVVYDPELKRVFLANGVNAVLNVFEVVDANTFKPVESLGTRAGVKALAYDAKGKKLFSVVAEGSADAGKKILTTVSPFYANTFVPNTFTILTYAR